MPKYILLILLFCISCSRNSKLHITGQTMGTTYSIKAYGKDLDEKLVKKEIDEFLINYNKIFSTYIEDSELSIINKADINKSLKVSSELFELLKKAQSIYIKTNGMYDVTVGPLVNRWGFGPVTKSGRPSSKEVRELLNKSGMESLLIENDKILKKKNIYIDLSSIAKGDGVDKVSKILENKFKIKDYFVEIGGEVRVSGKKDDRGPWRVGIEKPEYLQGSGLQKIITLSSESIATSGSYRNFIKYGESIFSHIVDPITGMPVTHKTISVSVIAKDCAIADAWATAFMSIGAEKSLELAKKEGLKAYFLVKENDKIVEYKTDNFRY